MRKTIISVFAFFAILLCPSCDKNYHEVFAPDELGMAEHEFLVEETGGDFDVDFLSNKKGSISLMDGNDYSWVQLGTGSFESDGSLSVSVKPNDGFKRRADILFSTDTRKDTVSIFQKGAVEEKLYVAASSMMVYNGTGEPCSVATDINIPLDEVTTEVRISGGEEWIKDCRLTSSSLTFSTTDNPDRSYMRRAYIALSYVDGWKEKQTEILTVIQARADNNIGNVFTAEDLRSVATVAGYALPDDALIEGYIVSTTEGGNAGDAQVSDYQPHLPQGRRGSCKEVRERTLLLYGRRRQLRQYPHQRRRYLFDALEGEAHK